MQFAEAFSHHHGRDIWRARDLDDWVTDLFENQSLLVGPGSTSGIRDHVRTELANEGWAYDVKIAAEFDLTVLGMKDDLAFHLQTGNISRAAYDLIKLQHLYATHRISAAALALPTKSAANKIGSNVANFERIMSEMMLFDRTITVPIFLIAFE